MLRRKLSCVHRRTSEIIGAYSGYTFNIIRSCQSESRCGDVPLFPLFGS